jgi:hypothetical protein
MLRDLTPIQFDDLREFLNTTGRHSLNEWRDEMMRWMLLCLGILSNTKIPPDLLKPPSKSTKLPPAQTAKQIDAGLRAWAAMGKGGK